MSKPTDPIAKIKELIEKTGTAEGPDAEDLAREIAEIDRLIETQKRDVFFTNPDGQFFIVESHGFAIPFGSFEQGLPPEADVQGSLAAPKAMNNRYAIVLFERQVKAEVFKARSIFAARAKAEEKAIERGFVSMAIQYGTYDGDSPLFRSLAFIDYMVIPEKEIEPSTNTVQTLIFDRSKSSPSQAKKWAKDHGFPSAKVMESKDEDTVQIHQHDPESFEKDSLSIVSINDGIKAVVGRPKRQGQEEAKSEEVTEILAKSDAGFSGDAENTDRMDRIERALGDIILRLDGESPATAVKGGEQDPEDDPDDDGDEDEEITLDDEEDDIDEDEEKIDPEKGEERDQIFEKRVEFVYRDDVEQMAFGIVYQPMKTDAHGDFMTEAEIKKMMKKFMKTYRRDPTSGIDKDHDSRARKDVNIVENFTVKKGDKRFPKAAGAWAMGVHIENKAIWKDVKKGILTGFSFAGMARSRQVKQAA